MKLVGNYAKYLILFLYFPASSQSCPEKHGYFPVSGQCDAYIQCTDGVAEEKLCPDGLLFNDKNNPLAYPCQYPIDVECGPRSKLQSAVSTEKCPHQFGYYPMGDASNCGKFKNCASGVAFEFECPEGLAYNKDTYRCDWPDQVADCNVEAYLGFTCPQIQKSAELGDEETRSYPSPHDCYHYYVCIKNKPRLLNCGEERAFNPETSACDGAENVTSCASAPSRPKIQQIELPAESRVHQQVARGNKRH